MDTDSLLLLWREYSIRGGMVAAKNIFFSPLRWRYWKIPSLVGLKLKIIAHIVFLHVHVFPSPFISEVIPYYFLLK